MLAKKKGKEIYLVPFHDHDVATFNLSTDWPQGGREPSKGYKRGVSGIFECAHCGTVSTRDHVADEAKAGRLGIAPIAVVAEGSRERVYLPPQSSFYPEELSPPEVEGLEVELSPNPRDVWCRNFGLTKPKDLFTIRQLILLSGLCNIFEEAKVLVESDLRKSTQVNEGAGGSASKISTKEHARAIYLYLAFIVDKLTESHSNLCTWLRSKE